MYIYIDVYIYKYILSKNLRVTTWTPPQQQLKPPRVFSQTHEYYCQLFMFVESFQVGCSTIQWTEMDAAFCQLWVPTGLPQGGLPGSVAFTMGSPWCSNFPFPAHNNKNVPDNNMSGKAAALFHTKKQKPIPWGKAFCEFHRISASQANSPSCTRQSETNAELGYGRL